MRTISRTDFFIVVALGALLAWWQGEALSLFLGAAFGYGWRCWQETEHFHRFVAWGARQIDRLAGVR